VFGILRPDFCLNCNFKKRLTKNTVFMRLKRTLPFLLAFLPALCCAQLRLYFNEYLQPVDSGRPYSYYEEVRQYSNGTVRIKVFDKAGFPISDGSYSSFGQTGKEQKEEGMHRFYRPGQKIPWYQQEFKNGIKEGDLSSWYPTGEVKRIEHFHEGKSVGGECYARDGSVIPFTPFTKAPEFPGGAQALEAYWEKNIQYPDIAYDYGVEGDVVLDLNVDEKGRHSIFRFVSGNEYGMENEVIRLEEKMPRWIPGAVDDETKSLNTKVTVKFRLENERKNRKTAPGTRKFDLINDVIGTGNRFYIDEFRQRVKPPASFIYSGIAERQPDGRVYIKLYNSNDSLASEGNYSFYNSLFEKKSGPFTYYKYEEELYNESYAGLYDWMPPAQQDTADGKDLFIRCTSGRRDTLHCDAPRFPEGDVALMKFLAKNINYPDDAKENNIQGIVVISFIVQTDGSISSIKLVQDIGANCGQEAMRVVKDMPNWIPGRVDGQPVNVRFTLPIRFRLD
jgi:TonB family protein